jgi:chromate transporter
LLFGSGYVLLAFLEADLVSRLGWLTQGQLLDAIAVGQFTPGPVFTTATFVGYLVAGNAGALVATAGIFLPAFVFVALSAPALARWKANPDLRSLLDGVNAASLAMMAAVTVTLARDAFLPSGVPRGVEGAPEVVLAVALFATSLWLLLAKRVNSAWLVLGGALAGLLLSGA